MPEEWQIADGWATEAEAQEHAKLLREAPEHSSYEFKVHEGKRYGGGNWLVLYRAKDDVTTNSDQLVPR